MRSLALQGLSIASQNHPRIKQALASCETDEDLQVLRDVSKEVKGKGEVSSDLTRWAAAKTIEEIGFSLDAIEHLEGGALTDPPYRIRNEMIARKLQEINRIQRFDSRGEFTAEYERHLEFWLFGPTEELFRDNSSSCNYEDIVGDVICQLHGRGVYLGLDAPNTTVQAVALRQARQIFKESTETEEALYGILENFLSTRTHKVSLRIIAAEIISTASDLKKLTLLSKLLLEETELRNTAVRLLAPYKQELARVEPDAFTVLEAIDFPYRLDKPEPKSLFSSEIKGCITSASQYHSCLSTTFLTALAAAEELGRVYQQSAATLKEFLQSKRDGYLTALKSQLITALETIDFSNKLEAIDFSNKLDKPELINLSIPEIRDHIASASQYRSSLSTTFLTALSAAKSLAIVYESSTPTLKEFLQNKRDGYLLDVDSWIQRLEAQIAETSAEQRKVQENFSVLREALSASSNVIGENDELSLSSHLNSEDYETYNKCQKFSADLTALKNRLLNELNRKQNELLKKSKKNRDIANNLQTYGWGIILATLLILTPLANLIPTPTANRNSNSYSSPKASPWYLTGFPKSSCGSSFSSNNCWHPVFIEYSDENWSRVISNQCRDIEEAQSKKTARERGKIQVASFGSSDEAQGFANYMKEQYSSGFVGETKCK
jgi:predicted RNA-binding protein YlxR (DUF448 family)